MSASPIPESLKVIFAKLDFLAQNDVGEIPNVLSMTFSDARPWLETNGRSAIDSLRRTLSYESAETTLQYIEEMVRETIEAFDNYSSNIVYRTMLINKLTKCRSGIVNMIKTYSDRTKENVYFGLILNDIDLILETENNTEDGQTMSESVQN